MNKGQATLPFLIIIVGLSALLYWRANQFMNWWNSFRAQQRIYLCAKSALAQRQQHAREVVLLNKVIVGADLGLLIPPLSPSATNAKKMAQALQQASGIKNFLKIMKNPHCSIHEKTFLSRPVFQFQSRNPTGTLSYQLNNQSFTFYSPGHILWAKSDQSRGPFQIMAYSFKHFSMDKPLLNFWLHRSSSGHSFLPQ